MTVTFFLVAYFGFLYGYPPLQLWTLLRCSGWWRVAAALCFVPAAPFYAWAVMDHMGRFKGASLGAIVVAFLGPAAMLHLAAVALGFEAMNGARRRGARAKA